MRYVYPKKGQSSFQSYFQPSPSPWMRPAQKRQVGAFLRGGLGSSASSTPDNQAVLDAAVSDVFKKYIEPTANNIGPYNIKGKGVPKDVVWNNKVIWKSDGTQFCSGAVWWLLVELMKLAGLEELSSLQDGKTLMEFQRAAWVWNDTEHHAGLPKALVDTGMGVWVCNGETNPDPSLFKAGRFYQFWTSWEGEMGYRGHTGFIRDGIREDQASFIEWSSSPVHKMNPATQVQKIAGKKWFIASLHPDFSGILYDLLYGAQESQSQTDDSGYSDTSSPQLSQEAVTRISVAKQALENKLSNAQSGSGSGLLLGLLLLGAGYLALKGKK